MTTANTFIEVRVKATFVHPSGMQYNAGSKLKLTPTGVKAWLKEGWIEDPDAVAPAAPVAAPEVPATPVPAADIPTAGG